MSERWKYQIKTGGIWGGFMSVFMLFFDIKTITIAEQLSKPSFYIRAIAYIVLGIFVLGYFTWKSKNRRENNK